MPPSLSRKLLPALVLLVLPAVVACGGSGRPSGPADVERDITAALTTTEGACEPLAYGTKRFADQGGPATADPSSDVEQACRRDVERYVARSVRVSHVKVDGDRATALVTTTGGPLAIGDLTFALVRDGVWKIDRIAAIDIVEQTHTQHIRQDGGDGNVDATVVASLQRDAQQIRQERPDAVAS